MRRFITVKEEAGMPNETEELTLEQALAQLKKAQDDQAELKTQLEVLQAAGGTSAEAAAAAAAAAPAEVIKSAADELREFAQMGLNTAELMIAFGEMDPALMPLIEEQLGAMKSLAETLEVGKSAARLPEIFGEDEPDQLELRKAASTVLKSMAQDAATLSMTMGASAPTQAAKSMIGRFYGNLEAIAEAMNVKKSAKRFSSTLRDVAERALALSARAEEAGVDARTLRQARQLRDLVQGLVDSSSIAKSTVAPSMEDLRTVLDVSAQLDGIEDVIVAKEGDAPPAEDPPAEDPPAEEPPVEDPPAEDSPAEDPPAEEPTEVEKELAEVKKAQGQAAARVLQLEAYIRKCRGEVPEPAAVTDEVPRTPVEKSAHLFPNNYNDPAERARWERDRAARRQK